MSEQKIISKADKLIEAEKRRVIKRIRRSIANLRAECKSFHGNPITYGREERLIKKIMEL